MRKCWMRRHNNFTKNTILVLSLLSSTIIFPKRNLFRSSVHLFGKRKVYVCGAWKSVIYSAEGAAKPDAEIILVKTPSIHNFSKYKYYNRNLKFFFSNFNISRILCGHFSWDSCNKSPQNNVLNSLKFVKKQGLVSM